LHKIMEKHFIVAGFKLVLLYFFGGLSFMVYDLFAELVGRRNVEEKVYVKKAFYFCEFLNFPLTSFRLYSWW
jgi:hypothetical protein